MSKDNLDEPTQKQYSDNIAVSSDEEKSNSFINKSIIHIQKGKVKAAIKDLFKALKIEPWNIEIASQIATLFYRMNDKKSALQSYDVNLQYLKRYKKSLPKDKYYASKLAIYNSILTLDPGNIGLRRKIADYYMFQRNHKSAYIELFAAAEFAEATKDQAMIDSIQKDIEKVQLDDFEKDLAKAEYLYRTHGDNTYIQHFTQTECKYIAKPEKLYKLYDKHLVFFPNDTDIIRKYAMLLIRKQEYRKANSYLRKVLSLDKNNILFLELLSITCVRLNLLNEALEYFIKLKDLYDKTNSAEKLALTIKNIENIKKKIMEASFPEEMPPAPETMPENKSQDVDTNINDENNIPLSMIPKDEGAPDVPIMGTRVETIMPAPSPTENCIDLFSPLATELINFYHSQTKEADTSVQTHDAFIDMYITFTNKAKQIVSTDARSCIDLGIAYQTIGFYDAARDLYSEALRLDPKLHRELEELIQICDDALSKTRKLAA